MTPPAINYTALIAAVLQPNIYRATKFISPTLVIKATRRRFKGKLQNGRAKQETILLTIGKPNYLERHFIKLCRQAREPFPIKAIQLKLVPC